MDVPNLLLASEDEVFDLLCVKETRMNAESPSAVLMCTETLEIEQDMDICNEVSQISPADNSLSPDYAGLIQSQDPIYQPSYSQLRNPLNGVRPYMRAMLLDNMRMICAHFSRSRECFHLSINIIDRVISLDQEITRTNFQLYGIVAVYLANQKIESQEFKPRSLLETADGQFNLTQFRKMMLRTLRLLQWKLTPVTLYDILSFCLKEWDYFANLTFRTTAENNAAQSPVEGLSRPETVSFWMLTFFDGSFHSDERAVFIFNVLDTSVLSIEVHKGPSKWLVAGLFYVFLSFLFSQTSYGMLGFNSTLHQLNVDVRNSLEESSSLTISSFLSSRLQLPSLDVLQFPISLFSKFLHCPKLDLTRFYDEESPSKLWRQLHNGSALQWVFDNGLSNN